MKEINKEELGEDTKFTMLNLNKKTVDEIMDLWKFQDPMRMFETAVLLLHSFSVAAQNGCEQIYFEVEDEKGEKAFYVYKFAEMIRSITNLPNDGSSIDTTFSMGLNKFKNNEPGVKEEDKGI